MNRIGSNLIDYDNGLLDYPTTMYKLKDIVYFQVEIFELLKTPINQNVGKQNALTVSTHITDEDVLFDVYDKNFQKITISYLDYLNKKVVASESVDYETNTLKPDSDGKVVVKYRMKRISVPVEEAELIDLHPDYRLSEEVRRIPFVNYTDSVRIHMGSSIYKCRCASKNIKIGGK